MKPVVVLFMALLVALTSIGTADPGLPVPLAQTIDHFLTERVTDWEIPGMALVIVQGDRVIYNKAFGLSDLERNVLMTTHTPIAIGSTTKAMTALAVMQLVDRHQLDLDEPIHHYLPWFELADERGQSITTRQILSHSSGLPPSYDLVEAQDPDALEQAVRELSNTYLQFSPGERFQYTNDGFNLAGMLIQQVSGMPYEDYMAQNIFAPLQMNDSTFDPVLAEEHGLAQCYAWGYSPPMPRSLTFSRSDNPAGMLVASSTDIGRYFSALLNRGHVDDQVVISETALQQMWSPIVAVYGSNDTSYGLGWFITGGDLPILFHSGDRYCSGSDFVLFPDRQLAIGLLTNFRSSVQLRFELLQSVAATVLFLGEPHQAFETSSTRIASRESDPSLWSGYLGSYTSAAGAIEISMADNRLVGSMLDSEFDLIPYSDTRFTIHSATPALDGLELEFVVREQGSFGSLPGRVINTGRLLLMNWQFGYKRE
ncbi:MAG: beta-lactamase family protein [Trueperaceae bacterium]|nr:MAG: beta-lactamase family protein [Trueperaceae bacterium]